MRREVMVWTSVGVGVVALLGATVAVLSATVYSPAAFVTGYLDALAAGDARAAAALPGVGAPGLDAVPEGPRDVVVTSADSHHVTVTYSLSGDPASTTFAIEPAAPYLGVFPAWRFATSPLEPLDVAALHDDAYTVNGIATTDAHVELLAPAVYTLDHETALFTATDVTVALTGPAAAIVDTRASDALDAAVAQAVSDSLDACAAQAALKPGGCPFGLDVDDRIVAKPTWAITEYPDVAVVPTADGWGVLDAEGVAHVRVRIRSLLDGSVSTLERDVPFTADYTVVPNDETATVTLSE